MRILVGDEILNLSYINLAKMYLGRGCEAKVYKYKDEALKIYRPHCIKLRLDEDSALELTRIDTERILLPRKLIYDCDTGAFIGYTTRFIYKTKIASIFDMEIGNLVSEVNLLRSEAVKLADSGVIITDFNINNTIFNNGIYLVDPGSYKSVNSNYSLGFRNFVRDRNVSTLNEYIEYDLFRALGLNGAQREMIGSLLGTTRTDFANLDLNLDTDTLKEPVKQYIKRL